MYFLFEMLPIVETSLEFTTIDIFQPLKDKPFKKRELKHAPTSQTIPSRASVSTSPSKAGKLFCATCKKSFNNEATWMNHQNSAKHISNVKEQMKSTAKINVSSITSQTRAYNENISPEIQDAQKKRDQALKLSTTSPDVAASVYWNVSKIFYKNRCIKETQETLSSLIDLLVKWKISPNRNSSEQTVPSLTDAQVKATLFLARLALARLYSRYYEYFELARKEYWNALSENFGVGEKKIGDIVRLVLSISVEELLHQCEGIYDNQVMKPLPKSKNGADPNFSAHVIFAEVGWIFAQQSLEMDYEQEKAQHQSVVLLGIATSICRLENCWSQFSKNIEELSKVYEAIRMPWCTCTCLMMASFATFQSQLNSESKPLSTTKWWYTFMAMLRALELSDFVCFKELKNKVNEMTRLTNQTEIIPYEIKFLSRLGQALEMHDHKYLNFDLNHDFARFSVLVLGQLEILNAEELVLCREVYKSDENSQVIINRIKDIIAAP